MGDDLTLGTVGISPNDENGCVVTRDLPIGEFLRLLPEERAPEHAAAYESVRALLGL